MGRAVIIGSGLGGLECGLILARNGWDVTVLEQGARIGGCLQSFRRGEAEFDTGFHHVGGLGEGENLRWLFEWLGLMDLPWKRMDDDCVDEVIIGSRTYRLPCGDKRLEEYLTSLFPAEAEGIKRYISTVRAISDGVRDILLPDHDISAAGISAYEFLRGTLRDEKLIQVMSSMTSRMQYDASMTPLYEYAQITGAFMQSGWRLKGTGQQIADRLAGNLAGLGGKVLTGCRAVSIRESGGRAEAVVCSDGRVFEGDVIISDAHPSVTMRLAEGCPSLKNISRKRIDSLKDSNGALTVNIRLKPGTVPYVNHSIFIHPEDSDTWHGKGSRRSVLVSFGVPGKGDSASTMDLLTEVRADEFAEWESTSPGRRDDGYLKRKTEIAEECISIASERLHGLRDAIDGIFVSTPLTYRDYTSTRNGSAFGTMKDFNSPITTFLSPKTSIRGLYMTGQNLNLHGILGVSLTALYTCAEILGAEEIRKQAGL